MGTKTTFLIAVTVLYIIFGVLMYLMLEDGDLTIIILGPAKMLWNLVFGFLGTVEI